MAPNYFKPSQAHTKRGGCELGESGGEGQQGPFQGGGVISAYPQDKVQSQQPPFKAKIVWRSTLLLLVGHVIALYGAYLLLTGQISVKTFLVGWSFGMLGALGITAGAHRYWAHKSYKATLPLQIFLAFCQTISVQNSIYEWCRDHRVHHKYSETDADPHNAKRGFFFAHMGWLMVTKHPDVALKGKNVDMSDLENDPVVRFQRKYYIPLILICSYVMPVWVVWMSGETLLISGAVTTLRYILSLHFTWLVNSAAHFFGPRPYDKTMSPAENVWVSFFAWGEGMHNFHHCFPWDYKTSELGLYRLNATALFIDLCAKLGLAYGLKTVPQRVVELRMARTGDKTQAHYKH